MGQKYEYVCDELQLVIYTYFNSSCPMPLGGHTLLCVSVHVCVPDACGPYLRDNADKTAAWGASGFKLSIKGKDDSVLQPDREPRQHARNV